ncbi:MAG: hypothetical protein WCV73_02530 [Patescibacteria group bacterium]|jgi:hypothetical protein
MPQNYQQLFKSLPLPEPADGLADKIISAISEQALLKLRFRLFFGLTAILACGVGFWWSGGLLQNSLVQSGFWEFFKLFFSDASSVVYYWQSFLLALLESLPVLGLAAILAVTLVFIMSLKFININWLSYKAFNRPNNYGTN